MIKFVHTADLQLGMTRHFLSPEAQARFSQARIDAIGEIGRLAVAEQCAFILVCGDVFESSQLDRQVVVRSLDAFGSVAVPIYLLPGNHDPLNASSIYCSAVFERHRPPNVHVLDGTQPVVIEELDLEIVGAPWRTKHPLEDLVSAAVRASGPRGSRRRVVAGHGATDETSPALDNPAILAVSDLEALLDEDLCDYIGLGDRHSMTDVGTTGRIWYAGTPVATDYDEVAPNHALVVSLGPDGVDVEANAIGHWHFLREHFALNDDEDLEVIERWLDEIDEKPTTVVKLSFEGTVSLALKDALDALLERAADLLAALEIWERHDDLHVVPDDDDLHALELSGFAQSALEDLLAHASGDDRFAADARAAIGLLFRLSRSDR